MFIQRKHPKGGPRLRGLPLHTYPLGYKLGYVNCHCGRYEPILVKMQDIDEFLNRISKTREPIIHKLIKALGGSIMK